MEMDPYELSMTLQDATIGDLEFWEKSVFQPDVDGISIENTRRQHLEE